MTAISRDEESSKKHEILKKSRDIKKHQEEALAQLEPSTLYVFLKIRDDPPKDDDFHWGYYIHEDIRGGIMYHLTSIHLPALEEKRWLLSCDPTYNVLKSELLCVLIKIADVPKVKHAQLDAIMKSLGNGNTVTGISCRVWLILILEKLVQGGLIGSTDSQEFERECKDFGNIFKAGAARNEQPRPVVTSTKCHQG